MQCNMKEETRLVTEETPTEFSAALNVEKAGPCMSTLISVTSSF